MKRLVSVLLLAALVCALAVPAMAATEPVITRQPYSPTYIEYDLAMYSVTVKGNNLRCTWYLNYEGREYNISDTSGGMKPWEIYAGETYGALQPTVNGEYTTFTYHFGGIGRELDGCSLYAVIEDGHFDITTNKVYIRVVEDCAPAPEVVVPVAMDVTKGEVLDLYCQAVAKDGSTLSYLWYETSTGDLKDIVAVNRGAEDQDTLRVDTGAYGTRYYVCAVSTANGGSAYSSVIPVTVLESQPTGELPAFITEALPEAYVDAEYEFQIECSDPNATFSIYYDPGKANDFESTGLTLSENGLLSGTPHLLGRFPFTVCVSNDVGEDYRTFILDVGEGNARLEVLEVPDKVEYFAGETLDLTGLKVRVYNSDGTYFDSVNGDQLTVTTNPLTTVGEQKIKVAYGDLFDIFIVTVKEAPEQPPVVEPDDPDKPDPDDTKPDDSDTKPEDTKPTGDTGTPTTATQANNQKKDEQKDTAMPWWGIALIAVAAAGAGVGVTVLILKKKQ